MKYRLGHTGGRGLSEFCRWLQVALRLSATMNDDADNAISVARCCQLPEALIVWIDLAEVAQQAWPAQAGSGRRSVFAAGA